MTEQPVSGQQDSTSSHRPANADLRNPYADFGTSSNDPRHPSGEGDATGGVIPYKNPPALIAYYLGLFSLFPFLGLFLAIPAFILGIIGLKKRKQDPAIRGSVHAWIGIVMGGLMSIVWGVLTVGAIVALMAG